MPLASADLKRRRRVASRTLAPGSRKKKHLVDGEWVDTLPFNAGEEFLKYHAYLKEEKEALEQAVAAGDFEDEIYIAEPAREPDSCCVRCLRALPRSFRVKFGAEVELRKTD